MRRHIRQEKWTKEERASFGDGVRVRATTIPDKRKKASKEACRRSGDTLG